MKKHFSCLFLFFFILASQAVFSQSTPPGNNDDNPVLISNNVTEIRLNEFLADLTRLPAEKRGSVANRRDLIDKQLTNMLETKTLAVFAEQDGLDKVPMHQAMLKLAEQSQLAIFTKNKVYEEAEKAFEASQDKYEARAREKYQIGKKEKYTKPPQVRVSHILIEVNDERKSEEAKMLATQVRDKVAQGEDFNRLADKFSDDPGVKRNHGKLGWVDRRTLEPPFAEAAFSLEKDGDISEPVRTMYGWHLIKREGYKDVEVMPFDVVKIQIMGDLKKEAMNERLGDLSAKIRQDANLKLHEDAILKHVYIPPMEPDVPVFDKK